MRHRVKKNNLNMQSDHRLLLIRGLVTDLFLHSKIKTTLKRAKITSSEAEKLITYVKKHNPLLAIRKLKSYLLNEEASKNILEKSTKNYKNTTAGFTRITKAGYRSGDNAEVCYLELI